MFALLLGQLPQELSLLRLLTVVGHCIRSLVCLTILVFYCLGSLKLMEILPWENRLIILETDRIPTYQSRLCCPGLVLLGNHSRIHLLLLLLRAPLNLDDAGATRSGYVHLVILRELPGLTIVHGAQ